MKALVLKEYKVLALEDCEDPRPGTGEVRVAVRACGICGSDVHGYDGSTGRRRPPLIMGHEAAGVIDSVGPGISAWRPGDRVTFDSTVYCGECVPCRRGAVNLCDRRMVLGVSCAEYRRHGAFADYVVVPERILYRVPDEVSFDQAAMLEALAIALHAVRRSGARMGDSAVVVGAGMIGLLVIQALRAAGLDRIIAADVDRGKLDIARGMGATDALISRPGAEEEAAELTHGGADLAFEVVGVSDALGLALGSVRKGGTLTLVGNVSPEVRLPLQTAVTREVSVFGSCASAGEYPLGLELIRAGKVEVEALISATAPLNEGPLWFERLYHREPGLMKVILAPGKEM